MEIKHERGHPVAWCVAGEEEVSIRSHPSEEMHVTFTSNNGEVRLLYIRMENEDIHITVPGSDKHYHVVAEEGSINEV